MKKLIFNTKQTKEKLPLGVGLFAVITASILQLSGVTSIAAANLLPGNPQPATVSYANLTTCTNKDDYIPRQISIKKVGINLPVTKVALQNGTWKVNEGVANYAEETNSVSKMKGNVGIFAHDKENGFTNIKKLSTGDEIVVKTAEHTAAYKVISVGVSDPANVEAFYPTEKPTLTLITCDGAFSEQRFVVKAKLMSISEGECNV